jgi:caa(3)-type oxidase subunit IV
MSENSKPETDHVLPLKTYLATGAALLALTAITVGVSFIHLGGWNAIVAVGIASIKALLVALIFMHLLYDKKVFLVIFSTAIVFLGIFLALTMFDILSRGDIYPDVGQQIEKSAPMYENMEASPSHDHDSGQDSESNDH